MIIAKPQKRLVNKTQYIRIMGKKWSLYSTSAVLTALALAMVYGTTLDIFRSVTHTKLVHFDCIVRHRNYLLEGGEFFFFLFVFVKLSLRMHRSGRAIENVRLLTVKNSHLLPSEESLLRASDFPPSQQRAELLRAAQYGEESPAEELLRAGRESKQNV